MGRWADQKISIAFMKMLQNQSVDEITVIKLCEKAGVNRQSFYYHFKDMSELINYVVKNKLEKLMPKENLYRKWPEYLKKVLSYSKKHKKKILNIYNSSYKAEFIHALKDYSDFIAKQTVESYLKEANKTIDQELLAFLETTLSMTCVGIYQRYVENGLTEDPAKVSDWCAKVFVGSVEFIIGKSEE